MSIGYEKLVREVKKDCEGDNGIFNPEGCCEKCSESKCFHKYCNKFKWIIDRAKAYGAATHLNWEDILDKWEEERNYWYMNYYQEYKQPDISTDKVRVFETLDDLKDSIGKKGFRCPSCGKITSSPYECFHCNWAIYGLMGDLGKGVFVFVKEKCSGENIFMPIEWEEEKDNDDGKQVSETSNANL